MSKIYLALLIFTIGHVQAQFNIFLTPDGFLNYFGQTFRYAGPVGTYSTGTSGSHNTDANGYPTGVQGTGYGASGYGKTDVYGNPTGVQGTGYGTSGYGNTDVYGNPTGVQGTGYGAYRAYGSYGSSGYGSYGPAVGPGCTCFGAVCNNCAVG